MERQFDRALSWEPAARQFQARVNLLRTHDPQGGWPDLTDEHLRPRSMTGSPPGFRASAASRRCAPCGWWRSSAGRWTGASARGLDTLAPETWTTPAGNRRRLDYLAGPEPVLPVPVQELFGTRETPSLCAGRVPVMLHLLSPAGRPVQITRDLAGFWTRGYPEVRKELRGRYPKHPWPEDPLAAAPVTKTRGPRT